MSGTRPVSRLGYKLIPQSNSESSEFSEDELRSFYEDGFQIITKRRVYSAEFAPLKASDHSDSMDSKMVNTRPNIVFQPYKKETSYHETIVMSTKRKFSLATSIFVCFLTIILFLILPCEWANCSCIVDQKTRKTWQKIISNIELRGPIFVVHTSDWHLNLIVLARGSVLADSPVIRTNYTSSSGGDLVAFDGLNGNQIWRKHFNKMPNDIDCSIFSIRNHPSKDCIIVNYKNYITVVSSENGRSLWSMPFSSKTKMKEIFPIVVPDMNEDHILDFVIVTDSNKMLFISGHSGTILNNDFSSQTNCNEIKNISVHNESNLQLTCQLENEVTEINLPLKLKTTNVESIRQHDDLVATDIQTLIYDYSIEVNNEGNICPKKCYTEIIIKTVNDTIVWSHKSNYSYTTGSRTFNMNYTIGAYGFVFKILEFEHEDTERKRMMIQRNDIEPTINFLYERTMLVVFNLSFNEPFQVVNMNYNPIIQLYTVDKIIQPDPTYQQYSLTITDINKNGSHQIITYYSTFVEEKRDNVTYSDYTLKSYIRTYDLEAEIIRNLNVTQ